MFIAIDFDGTCVTHAYPNVGEDIGAVPVLRALTTKHKLILHTMRDKDKLAEAVKWFEDNGIPLSGINCNKSQFRWTSSPKIYAHLYIDDAALGIPLITPEGERPYVDWEAVSTLLKDKGIL